MIKMKWFGHSFWKIYNEDVSIVIDPFTDIGYTLPQNLRCDIALSSHDHFDHNNVELIEGDYILLNKPGTYTEKDIPFQLISVWHDESKGSERGSNLLMKFRLEDITFLHCGDLGHIPSLEVYNQLRDVNVLLIPVGGVYTVEAEKAKEICDELNPDIIFPMHYQLPELNFELHALELFTKLYNDKDVHYHSSSEISLSPERFSGSKPSLIVMKYES